MLYSVKCDAELNTPEVIERNELRARIGIVPARCVELKFADDLSYMAWADAEIRSTQEWVLNECGEVQLVL